MVIFVVYPKVIGFADEIAMKYEKKLKKKGKDEYNVMS